MSEFFSFKYLLMFLFQPACSLFQTHGQHREHEKGKMNAVKLLYNESFSNKKKHNYKSKLCLHRHVIGSGCSNLH